MSSQLVKKFFHVEIFLKKLPLLSSFQLVVKSFLPRLLLNLPYILRNNLPLKSSLLFSAILGGIFA
jgi:hypothetical protein